MALIHVLMVLSSFIGANGLEQATNPVRKVVTMLQLMQRKVMQEGEKEKELHDKFVCYCDTYSNVELRKECKADRAKIAELTSSVEAAKGKLDQLREDLKKHAAESTAAKAAMDEATAIREKEAATFASDEAEDKKNIAALKKALAAIEKGMGSSFLQTGAAQDLQKFFTAKTDMNDEDRRDVLSFLSGKSEAPSSDMIAGIMRNMLEEMEKALADMTAAEQAAITQFEQLMAAKQKEVKALTAAIETKSAREGELSVKLVDMENDLTDTKASLAANEKLLTELDKTCDAKEAEYEQNKKLRAEELVAIADTIKILNDDDALELFKKSIDSSFVQVKVSGQALRVKALSTITSVMKVTNEKRPKMDFIVLALKGKKIGLEGVIKMIDNMVATLTKEQTDDESKKVYCSSEFDTADDKKKAVENSISDVQTALDDSSESIAAVNEEIKALQTGIKDLDKSVEDLTEQRKEETAEFTESQSADTAAKQVLRFAKNRLNKFYNPALYVPPPKAELSEQDRLMAASGGEVTTTTAGGIAGTGVTFLQVGKETPPPPPAAVSAFKKSTQSTGVIEMIDLLIADLDKDMAAHAAEEKEAQADYEAAVKDSAEKRKADTATIEEKESMKADLEGQHQTHSKEKASRTKELAATLQYIHALHSECDFLLKYFDVRKEARAAEIEALKKAKQILSGADFSLAQTRSLRSVKPAF